MFDQQLVTQAYDSMHPAWRVRLQYTTAQARCPHASSGMLARGVFALGHPPKWLSAKPRCRGKNGAEARTGLIYSFESFEQLGQPLCAPNSAKQ